MFCKSEKPKQDNMKKTFALIWEIAVFYQQCRVLKVKKGTQKMSL